MYSVFYFLSPVICFLVVVCSAPFPSSEGSKRAQPETSEEKKDLENIRKVLPAKPPGDKVGHETMQKIYEEIKTPYKYGVILKGEQGKKVDCPSVFRYGDTWYMMYIIFDGSGYETAIAESQDLLKWKPLGKIMRFRQRSWDARQAAGFIALQDHIWGGSYELQKYEGKFWLSYIGGALEGYETDPLAIGISWTLDPTKPVEWNRLEKPVLSRDQPDVREFEALTQYKSNIIYDKDQTLGYPFVMFYNGKKRHGYERIGMAVSRDMKQWYRYGAAPVIDNGKGISGDPQIIKIGDVWVMFYFGAGWEPQRSGELISRKGWPSPKPAIGGAFDTFACSYDLVHWTKWDGPHLVEPSEPWDQTYAHKPWVIKHDGIVYHFFCAVGQPDQGEALDQIKPAFGRLDRIKADFVGQGRVIALATSKDLRE